MTARPIKTAGIATEFPVQLIRTPNEGLSSARNTAWQAARGDIVAYLDCDAYPDPHWLQYLAHSFLTTHHACVGGPNLVPESGNTIEQCVACSPGGPIQVLLTDERAEHVPGCNMAFRREALEAIGGFDERFRIAGDDVDVCWRLHDSGKTLAFHPAALVWHHRRNTIRGYFKQQFSYGEAEAMLERKWPHKYSEFGHPVWRGRIYEGAHSASSRRRWRVYHGFWGSALFQSLYAPVRGWKATLPLMPEWILAVAVLGLLGLLGLAWQPLQWALLPAGLAASTLLVGAAGSALRARFLHPPHSRAQLRVARFLVFGLHILQPLARLLGRLRQQLSPWRPRGVSRMLLPIPRRFSLWSETWHDPVNWLRRIERDMRARRVVVRRGDDFDRWDLEAWCGIHGGARFLLGVEEHGWGTQLLRVRARPRCAWFAILISALLGTLSLLAGLDRAWLACSILAAAALIGLTRTWMESSAAIASMDEVLKSWMTGAHTELSPLPKLPRRPLNAHPENLIVEIGRALDSQESAESLPPLGEEPR